GGALMDLGCYCLHWIRTVAGDEPTVVSASARCATPGVDLEIEAELAFTSGPTATLKCSMQPEDGVLFRRLRVEGDAPSLPQIVSGGDTTFQYQLRHVIEVIEGRAQPLTGGEDALNNMRAIDSIYRAAGLRPRGIAARNAR